MPAKSPLSISQAGSLGRSLAAYHDELDSEVVFDGFERVEEVIDRLVNQSADYSNVLSRTLLDQFCNDGYRTLESCRALLNSRAATGFIKRCHGDLHLRPLFEQAGMTVPFDSTEGDERRASTDVFYELAFVLMDLDHRGLVGQASAVLNQYLLHADEGNLNALRLLPLFMFCRAGIRAMSVAHTVNSNVGCSPALRRTAWQYLDLAVGYLSRKPPVMVAVGGRSGTGKSTISARLAAVLGTPPGAVLIRSDAERKIALGLSETERLSEDHYTNEASDLNYQLLSRKASLALAAGQSIVVDAVFLNQKHRVLMESVAQAQQIPFVGIWLEAPVHIMKRRIARRIDDASDANVAVIARQLKQEHGRIDWLTVDSVGTEEEVFSRMIQCVQTHGVKNKGAQKQGLPEQDAPEQGAQEQAVEYLQL